VAKFVADYCKNLLSDDGIDPRTPYNVDSNDAHPCNYRNSTELSNIPKYILIVRLPAQQIHIYYNLPAVVLNVS